VLLLVFVLLALAIGWGVIPLLLSKATANNSALIVIRANNAAALIWLGIALLGTAIALLVLGWLLRRENERRQRHNLLPGIAREHLTEGIALYDRQGRLNWINISGQSLLFRNGKLRDEAARLIERALRTKQIALQSLASNDGLSGARVTVQALPTAGGVTLIARPIISDSGTDVFYQRFLQRIVHDMRNPLAAIIAHAGNIQATIDPDPRTTRQAAQVIESEALRLTRLVDSLLFDARLSYVPLNAEPLDLVDLIEEMLYLYDERAIREDKSLHVETPVSRAPIEADHDLLVRALGNLIDNSLEYSAAGSSIRVTLETADNQYLIRIIDTGDGIAPQYLPDRVFEPLVRARPKESGAGSGLGLAIVKKIVELHGGRIQAESVLGAGTTMSIWLPR
jgi:signal transduction histidine kinase